MTYIIADIGSNFTTLQEAYLSIEAAAESGADMAKFQLFSEHDLYGDGSTERTLGNAAWLPHLAECCALNNIEFGCTAFSVEGMAMVDPYVKAYKVASSCVTHIDLLKFIASRPSPILNGVQKKKVFLSVGASELDEIDVALDILKGRTVTVMYCEASYPSRMFDPQKLRLLQKWCEIRSRSVGYSDHTTDIYGAPVIASRMSGVKYIEKHFTAFPLLNSPDRPHSLTPEEFRQMTLKIHDGKPKDPYDFGPSPEEAEFVKYHKVRKTDRGYYRVRK